MSNFFTTPADLMAGTTARAVDINDRLSAVEAAFDNVESTTNRALKLPVGTATNQLITDTAANRAYKTIGFDVNGNTTLLHPYAWKAEWQAGTFYRINDTVKDPTTKNIFFCIVDHTSAEFSLEAANWSLGVNVSDVEVAKAESEDAQASAEEAESNAKDWAYLTGVAVEEGTYSSKEYAIGEFIPEGSAKDWAVQAEGFVDGTNNSALFHALASGVSAGESLASKNASALSASASEASKVVSAQEAADALVSKNAAESAASSAQSSETNASSSASASHTSSVSSAESQGIASTKAMEASDSADVAAEKEAGAISAASNASGSSSAAFTSASQASASAASAESYKNSAISASNSAIQSRNHFDTMFLGSATQNPTADVLGNPLQEGALYFNSVDGVVKVWEGSLWAVAYASLSGALNATNNLDDVLDSSVARTNLGVYSTIETDAREAVLAAGIKSIKTLNMIGFYD